MHPTINDLLKAVNNCNVEVLKAIPEGINLNFQSTRLPIFGSLTFLHTICLSVMTGSISKPELLHDMLAILVAKGLDLNASIDGKSTAFEWLCVYPESMPPMIKVLKNPERLKPCVLFARALIDNGANIHLEDSSHNSCLARIFINNRLGLLKILLQEKVISTDDLARQDTDGATILHKLILSSSPSIEAVNTAIEIGIPLNALHRGFSALFLREVTLPSGQSIEKDPIISALRAAGAQSFCSVSREYLQQFTSFTLLSYYTAKPEIFQELCENIASNDTIKELVIVIDENHPIKISLALLQQLHETISASRSIENFSITGVKVGETEETAVRRLLVKMRTALDFLRRNRNSTLARTYAPEAMHSFFCPESQGSDKTVVGWASAQQAIVP